ncbi:MAG: hypothetical protein WBV94_01170 [Blastocatellia bacterium]
MQDSNQEIVRRVLSNVLTHLARPETAPTSTQTSVSEGGPIILIVLGNSEPATENVAQVLTERHRQPEAPERDRIQTQATHPGHERFVSLEGKPDNNAPKTCFMEPDRVCVNSGACEMRGY